MALCSDAGKNAWRPAAVIITDNIQSSSVEGVVRLVEPSAAIQYLPIFTSLFHAYQAQVFYEDR